MPDRYLREALLSSDRWNDLPVEAREFYVRLVLIVDDFGCYDGRPAVLANQCFPTLQVDVKPMLDALHAADMLVRYSNAGKPYVALMRWSNELLGKRKYPAPPVNNHQPTKPLRGKYQRPIGWRNPEGADAVSIMLDAQMRPAIPQPPEWRLVDRDCAPASTVSSPYIPEGAQTLNTTGEQTLRTDGEQSRVAKDCAPVVTPVSEAVQGVQNQKQTQVTESEKRKDGAQTLHTTAASGGNGEVIKLVQGRWEGLSEAQRLRWQDMLGDAISVPDTLAKAAAHVEANPETRARCEQGPDSYHAFLVRWLLREARAHAAYKGTH